MTLIYLLIYLAIGFFSGWLTLKLLEAYDERQPHYRDRLEGSTILGAIVAAALFWIIYIPVLIFVRLFGPFISGAVDRIAQWIVSSPKTAAA